MYIPENETEIKKYATIAAATRAPTLTAKRRLINLYCM
jgi:hypothetical protein